MENKFDYIYEDELKKLIISVDKYVQNNQSQGVSQMIGRRYGDMWERLVKSAFEDSNKCEISKKVYYRDYVNKWIEENAGEISNDCCKENAKQLLMKFIEENTGTSNQDMCDFTFEKDGIEYAVDTKYRFHSNDAKTVREIANSAQHLKYMGYKPILLMRTKREESIATAINRFEKAGWHIKCDKEASKFITDMAESDLIFWIEENVSIWNRLSQYQEELCKLRFDEEKWKF